MTTFSGLGLGLSLGFRCFGTCSPALLLLWWKKKSIVEWSEIEEDEYGNLANELFHFIFWKCNASNNNKNDTTHKRKLDPDEEAQKLGCSVFKKKKRKEKTTP
ncbi:hypothetical protein L484_021471 [Morus notabilis]|uniref:Uncharacterized protein n=1 Tax=Morus notabilis TaxID=981085 RepID=W9T0A7_9ROSA|nr:hypothetical protein L484_021471 [Morus notabilis]